MFTLMRLWFNMYHNCSALKYCINAKTFWGNIGCIFYSRFATYSRNQALYTPKVGGIQIRGVRPSVWSWRVIVPFDSFGQNRPPKMAQFGQNVQKTAGF